MRLIIAASLFMCLCTTVSGVLFVKLVMFAFRMEEPYLESKELEINEVGQIGRMLLNIVMNERP